MANCLEVLFMSDSSGLIQCCDPRIGTTFVSYRGIPSVQKNAIAVVGKDYLIAADSNKPTITAWALNSQESISGPKLVLPGKATALATSPDGVHSAVAIDAKIYVYQNNSGALLGVLTKHYRGVTKIIFMADSVHFVSCGDNGVVLIWNIATALPLQSYGTSLTNGGEPVYTFSNHTLPVTDAYISPGSIKGRLYTTSLDRTLKIYGLRDGSLLLSVAFESSLTALHPNAIESVLFVGTSEGKILEFNLDPLPRSLRHQAEESDFKKPLEGHSKAVTSLSASVCGNLLVSGSKDTTVIVWDIPSRQQLRIFNLKGEVSSIFFTLGFDNIFTENFDPVGAFQNFQRVSGDDSQLNINVMVKENLTTIEFGEDNNKEVVVVGQENSRDDVLELKTQLATALQKNKELYQFAVQRVLGNTASVDDDERVKKHKKKKKKKSKNHSD